MALSQAATRRPLQEELDENQRKIQLANLSLSQKLVLRLRGCVKISEITDYTEGVFVDVYMGNCKIHGIYYDQIHSQYDAEIRCPKCENNFLKQRMFEMWQEANV